MARRRQGQAMLGHGDVEHRAGMAWFRTGIVACCRGKAPFRVGVAWKRSGGVMRCKGRAMSCYAAVVCGIVT